MKKNMGIVDRALRIFVHCTFPFILAPSSEILRKIIHKMIGMNDDGGVYPGNKIEKAALFSRLPFFVSETIG